MLPENDSLKIGNTTVLFSCNYTPIKEAKKVNEQTEKKMTWV